MFLFYVYTYRTGIEYNQRFMDSHLHSDALRITVRSLKYSFGLVLLDGYPDSSFLFLGSECRIYVVTSKTITTSSFVHPIFVTAIVHFCVRGVQKTDE